MDYKEYFKGKKITIMGLGLLGRGVNLSKFLIECGAKVTITDLKTKKELLDSINKLERFRKKLSIRRKIKYILGKHRLEDFRGRDLIIRAAGTLLSSPYIKEAQKQGIPVEMDASLFARFSPATIVGITGTRGKSTVAHLIYSVLKKNINDNPGDSRKVYLGGNIRGMATLPIIKKTKREDMVVLELDSWQLQGFGEVGISPRISIFTNFYPDHQDYYGGDMKRYFLDKANIFKFQKKNDYFITSSKIKNLINSYIGKTPESKMILFSKPKILSSWKIKIPGEHNKENVAAAIEACKIFKLSTKKIKEAVLSFRGVPGRLEFVRKIKGVSYYNDTTSTTPVALVAALNTLGSSRKNIVLIAGGADKSLNYDFIAKKIARAVKAIIFFKGNATNKLVKIVPSHLANSPVVDNMKGAVKKAKLLAGGGDIVLLSPGAASFGIFKNEFDRGDQFVRIVRKMKNES